MELNLVGKKILVTGAGRGIGREVAIALAKAGCKVYALSRTQSTLDSLVQEYPDIKVITQDLSNWDESRAKLEQIEPLDGLVNNAAVCDVFLSSLEHTKDQLDYYMHNNLFGAINCTQVVARKMIEHGKGGSIVNISSVVGERVYPGVFGYGIAKAALAQASRYFALELGKHNIRVNTVPLSLVLTETARKTAEELGIPTYDILRERTPMGRVLTINDTIGPILYLLSDASAMVTGTDHRLDGGEACVFTTIQ